MTLKVFGDLTSEALARIDAEKKQLSGKFDKTIRPILQSIANKYSCDLSVSASNISVIGDESLTEALDSELDEIHEAITPYLSLIKDRNVAEHEPLYVVSSRLFEKSNHTQLLLLKKESERSIAKGKCYLDHALVALSSQRMHCEDKVKINYSNVAGGYFYPNELEILLSVKTAGVVSKTPKSIKAFFANLQVPKFDVSQSSASFIDPDMFQEWILSESKINELLNSNSLCDWHDSIIVNKKTGQLIFAKKNPGGITGEYGFDIYFGDNEFSKYAEKDKWQLIADLK